MTELPYEIWLLIADFLPDHQVRRLYSVNKALFNIAFDLLYTDISLGILPDRVIEETNPPILRSPLLSSRPTALQIVFYDSPNRSGQDVISMSTNFNISSLKPFLRSAIYYAKHKRVLPTIKLAHLALHAMPRLTRVTKLSFTSTKVLGEPFDATDDASLVIPEVIRTIGNRLQSLHIQSLFAIYLPPPPSLQLASLETFSIDACAPYHTREIHTIMLEKIPAFLLAHKSTIRNVSVAIDRCELDISPIFQCLQVMPYLYGIDLSLPYGYTRPFKSERDLVVAHRQHLGSLSLNFTPNTRNGSAILDFFPADWREATFPNVRTLTIPISLILFNRAPVTSMIIKQFSSSLVSLTLNDAFLPSSNSRAALPTFCQLMSNFPCLRDLSLSIYGFHLGDFSFFGGALPHLRSLFVNYYAVVTNSWYVILPPWALESFDCRTPDLPSSINDYIARQVAIFLPNIQWINKKPRKECLLPDWLKDRQDH